MKYYWIKLRIDFFSGKEIQWLLKQTNGSSYVMIYLRLCMEAAKNDTDTLINRVADFYEPYTWEDLSVMTGFPVDTVRACTVFLMQLKLLQIKEDGSIYIPNALSMVGSEKIEGPMVDKSKEEKKKEQARLRKRRQREREKEKQRMLQSGYTNPVNGPISVGGMLTQGRGFDPKSNLSDLISKGVKRNNFLP